MSEFDPIIEQLEESARRLDTDPGSIATPEFRSRCRARLAQAADRRGLIRNLPVGRKLMAVGLAASLSALLVVPAMAGPGGMSGTVASVSHGVRNMFGPPVNRDALLADPTGPFASPDATPTHPANHGADVSTVARATPEPGENHGEQVRQVARDNYGHNKATATATSAATATETATATATSTSTATATETAESNDNSDNQGSNVSDTAKTKPDTNHGSDVSSVAQSTPTADENHGQQVSTVAKDNHGQDVSSEAHGTPTATATPSTSSTTTPTSTPEESTSHSDSSSHGRGNGHGGD